MIPEHSTVSPALQLGLVAGLAFILSFGLTPLVRLVGRKVDLIDRPNPRSAHLEPVPRSGGYAILLAIVVIVVVFFNPGEPQLRAIILGGLIMGVAGGVDDLIGLSQLWKFLAQISAGGLAILGGSLAILHVKVPLTTNLTVSAIPAFLLTLLWIASYTNAFNFMDGVNGIAAGHAIVAGATLGVLSFRAGDFSGCVLATAISAAAAGFLPWNFPVSSIFMGDLGSGTLGFLLACLVVRYGIFSEGDLLPAAIVLLPFLMDTGVTLARRILRGEPFLRPHRSHFYQRLHRLGWSHARVTVVWSSMAIVCGGLALRWSSTSEAIRPLVLGVALAMIVGVFLAIERAERRRMHTAT